MKKRLIGSLLAALFVVGLLAPAALADVTGAGTFAGDAQVGKHFVKACDRKGLGEPGGKGLYAPTINPSHPGNGVWRLSQALTAVLNGAPTAGQFDVCGWLSPSATTIGATCGFSKGHSGQGQASAVNTLTGAVTNFKVFNIGWKEAAGGVLVVTGNYEVLDAAKGKTGKRGTLLAQVGVSPSDPLACTTGKPGNGATTFTTAGTFELLQPSADMHKPGKDCKGACPTK